MSYVSAALTNAMAAVGWSQIATADKAGVDRAMLNRYCNGAQLGADNFEKLLAILPAPHDAELTAAFVRDLLPPSAAGKVQITPLSSRVQEDNPYRARLISTIEAMDEPMRHDLLYLLERASRQKPIADLISSTVAVLRGDPRR